MNRVRVKLFETIQSSYWLLVFPIFEQTIPWIGQRVRGSVTIVFIIAWLLFVNKRARAVVARLHDFDKAFFLCFVFSIFCYFLKCVYWVVDFGDLIQYYRMASLINNMSYLYVLYVIIRTGRIRELKFLTILSMLGLVIAGVSSFRGMIAGVEGARSVANASFDLYYGIDSDLSDVVTAYHLGMSRYGDLYIDAAIMGVILYAFFKIKVVRIRILLGLVVLGLYCALRSSGLGTPMFVMFYSVAIGLGALLVRRRFFFNIIAIFGVLVLVIFIVSPSFFSFLSVPIRAFSETLDDGALKLRVVSVADGLSGDEESYAVTRYKLQKKSFSVFCENPFFGIGSYNFPHPKARLLGGHSFLLDKMGAEGLLGLSMYLVYVFFIFKCFKECSKIGLDVTWLNMVRIYLWSYFFASIANPIPCYAGFVFLMLPGLALFFPKSGYMRYESYNVPMIDRRCM